MSLGSCSINFAFVPLTRGGTLHLGRYWQSQGMKIKPDHLVTTNKCSCTLQNAVNDKSSTDWCQLWHIGSRALTFSATCRAAAVEVHAILAVGTVQYHEVSEDIEAIITAADISGPVVLCDSALLLMAHLLHARVTEVPGASIVACSHIIRWLFGRWNPCKYIKQYCPQSCS